MSSPNVVVDGSNIATEGRSAPSLAQLDEAVREYLREHPDAVITVVVDATFGHRIDDSERQMFEEARSAGEIISPPAGAIGRGDAFLLRIAEKTGATVLSNDSFQEFHGEHDWLFTTGRLVGGVPVAGVGWIFTPRTPVRGPRSREAVKAAKRQRPAPPPRKSAPPRPPRTDGKPQIGDTRPAPLPGGGAADVAEPRGAGGRRRRSAAAAAVDSAIAEATEEVVHPAENGGRRRRRRRAAGPPSDPLNEPLAFINFVAAHRLGTEVEGEVDSFSSHGAFVSAGGVRCYVPLSAMGDPPPRSAREVLNKGEKRSFVVQALDPPRRGVELALPEFVRVAGAPTEETVEAEIAETAAIEEPRRGGGRRTAAKAPADTASTGGREPAKKAATKATGGAPKKTAATKTAAKKTGAKKTAAKKAAAKAPAGKAASRATAPKKAAAAKKAATRAAPKKAATRATTPKKTAATKTAPKKAATKTTAPKKSAPAKKAPTKKAPAKKAPAKKAPAKKATATAPAKKATAKKATTKKAPAKKATKKASS